jgi:hypothetical protein
VLFSRSEAAQLARVLSRDEFVLSIQTVCSAFGATFSGIQSIHDAREMIEVLAREKQRRDILDTIAQTEVPFTRLSGTPRQSCPVCVPRAALERPKPESARTR